MSDNAYNKNLFKYSSNATYHPINSSYSLRTLYDSFENANIFVNNYASYKHLDNTQRDSYCADFNVYIQNKSAGEIFNSYEKMILNSQWDCRDNGDYHTILLGREYMFYNVDGKIVSERIDKTKKEDKLIFKFTYQNPINFFPFINKELVDNNKINVYDKGTVLKLQSKSKVDTYNNLEKMVNRDECRKFSENHFAISGFNLIGHSIQINSQVCNTMSEILKDDEKNTISILGDVDVQYIVEQTATPEFPTSSLFIDEEFEHKSDEFLANKLLEELRYCYQGSILIKFNPDIEIGDTITLMDNVSSTYGVFQVDSYEHSLDQRGLITSLIVRSSWTPKDPILDYHSQTIGYKLIEELKNQFNLNGNEDEIDNQIHKIMSLYLKYIVQSPKYCVFYKKKESGFFNPSTVAYGNVTSPTALPLRFFPMINKGVPQIPKSLEYAFVKGIENNNIQNLINVIYAGLATNIKDFFKGITSGLLKTFYFISDMIISTVTFNMSELLKPLIGITSDKALKQTFDEVVDINSEDALNMLQYNPYEKKYKLLYNNFDIVFGFFNIRLQKQDDLYAENKLLEKTPENNQYFINRKVKTIQKLMNDVFDALFLVELYDGFKVNVGQSKTYNFEDFLDSCSTNNISIYLKTQISSSSYTDEDNKKSSSNEYGAILKNNDINFVGYQTIQLSESNRSAIEVTYDVSKLNISMGTVKENINENNYNEKSVKVVIQTKYLKELKIIFFHNLYGVSKDDKGINSVEIRRKNIRQLIEQYSEYYDSKKTGVIIMADFNLDVYNNGDMPIKSSAANNNFTYELPDDKFIAQIKSPTTLNQYGYLRGNKYDNVLLSKNINGLVSAKVFEYPEKDKLTISDHIPIYVGIKKMQE